MRFIIYGVGAIGGTMAARLALSGAKVEGIARGSMLEALRQDGLTLVTTTSREHATFPCHASPAEIDWQPDDVVILAMKTQDTPAAIEALLAAGVEDQAIVCAQNGVANEGLALRHFPNVYGLTVMLPAQYLKPGVVEAFGAPKVGIFDIGRVPSGTDATAQAIAAALRAAGFGCEVDPDVMASKHGKLLLNLGNIIGAALGEEARRSGPWYDRARAEAETVLKAAGVRWTDVGLDNPRRAELKIVDIPGVQRTGSSSQQSILRGTGSIETDWLNGEIVHLGRLHGIETPVNAALCRVARLMLRRGTPAGGFSEAELAVLAKIPD